MITSVWGGEGKGEREAWNLAWYDLTTNSSIASSMTGDSEGSKVQSDMRIVSEEEEHDTTSEGENQSSLRTATSEANRQKG